VWYQWPFLIAIPMMFGYRVVMRMRNLLCNTHAARKRKPRDQRAEKRKLPGVVVDVPF
jgi:hypothetical protein